MKKGSFKITTDGYDSQENVTEQKQTKKKKS